MQQLVLLSAMKEPVNFFPTQTSAATAFHISDEAEACAAVLVACLRASEIYGMTENSNFYTSIRSRNIFKGHDAMALIELAGRYFEQAGSPAALIDAAIGAIREQTRLPLFCHCLDVILSDGVVTPQENRIFVYLKSRFNVGEELAWKAMEVLLAKNQL
ncbi:MAG: TerB family tellurite resistance protein [Saprospiraceae bacterium]|nr:TerB family tellurite resistance protein [Saprospiraceae bacterium]